jgi:hypothetical protein
MVEFLRIVQKTKSPSHQRNQHLSNYCGWKNTSRSVVSPGTDYREHNPHRLAEMDAQVDENRHASDMSESNRYLSLQTATA